MLDHRAANPSSRRRTLACASCGYGIAVHTHVPGRCPMCGGGRWIVRLTVTTPAV